MYADQILVLEDGQITSRGTHEQLLTSSETYLDMWKAHISTMDWSMNAGIEDDCVHEKGAKRISSVRCEEVSESC